MSKTELSIGEPGRRVRVLARLSVLIVSLLSALSASAIGSLNLAGDPSPSTNLSGYVVRYGTTSGQDTMSTNVGNRTTATVGGLQDGMTYYFAVTAINTSGLIAVVQRWTQTAPSAAAAWISQFPESSMRDVAAQTLIDLWAQRDPESSGVWVRDLPNGTLRDAALGAYVQAVAAGDSNLESESSEPDSSAQSENAGILP